MSKVVLGENHPETLTSMNNLALLYDKQGESEKAMLLFEECLRMHKTVLGDHRETIITLINLAGLYKVKGESGKALSLYEEGLRMSNIVFGNDQLDILSLITQMELITNLLCPN